MFDINFETPQPMQEHALYMQAALREAHKALDNEEVPIGAVVVHDGRIIGRGYNQIELLQDPTAHAEILAIGAAAEHLGSWRLHECTLYVTLEPCMMCLGASLQSRINTIVYGAADSRFGALETQQYKETAEGAYRRWPVVVGAVLQEECKAIIQLFFKGIRAKNKALKKERQQQALLDEQSNTE